MNILFVLDHFYPHIGGAQTLFDILTQQHIKQGNTVYVLTNKHHISLPQYEIYKGIHITRVGYGRKNRVQMIQHGNRIIKQHNINLIHTSTYSAALPAWILSKQHKIPNQIHVHEIYGQLWHRFLGLKAYLNKRFEKLIVGLLPRDRYICVSRYTLNSIRTHFNITDHKIYLQSNPIDTQFWQPYNKDQQQIIREQKIKELEQAETSGNRRETGGKHKTSTVIARKHDEAIHDTIHHHPLLLSSSPLLGLFYGRTGVEKGLHLYIQALPDIIKLVPNFHAIIIAPNNESAPNPRSKRQTSYSLQQQLQTLGLQKHITRISPVNDQTEIKDRITVSDICILPSLTEGFGYAMHEVSLMNKPLITTQVGGQIETIINTNTYWMKQATSEEIIEGVKILLK